MIATIKGLKFIKANAIADFYQLNNEKLVKNNKKVGDSVLLERKKQKLVNKNDESTLKCKQNKANSILPTPYDAFKF